MSLTQLEVQSPLLECWARAHVNTRYIPSSLIDRWKIKELQD